MAITKTVASAKQLFEYPIISGRNVFVLDYINHLMDHHIIKRELRQAEQNNYDDSDEGDIFDDFFGGGGAKKKEEKKQESTKKIDVDKEMLLSIISDYYAEKGYVLLGLVLAYENKEVKMTKTAADNLVKNVVVEVVKGTKADNNDSTEKVTKTIDELVKRLKLKKEDYFVFVRNQYRFLENLRLEFRFIKTDKDSSKLLFRLEEELLKSINFINVMTAYPFAIDLERDEYSLSSILSLIEYLEDVVECMFIYENESMEEKLNKVEEEKLQREDEEDFFGRENSKSLTKPINSINAETSKPKGRYTSKIQVRSTLAMKKPGKRIQNENSQYMAEL